MTTGDGRRTVAYLAKCALSAGDTLVKQDQNGVNYTFPGGLGFAPGWKNGACDQNCQELVSACLMAHVNSYGVHYPIWIDSPAPSVGWGLPPSNYQMEGTFFGNIVTTGSMNHGSLTAPLGYYCDSPAVFGGSIVAGRIGDVNTQNTPPFYNAYLGSSCAWGNHCAAHMGNATTADGYTSCTDMSGNKFTNTVTTWRDLNGAMQFDANYIYTMRSMLGSAGLTVSPTGGSYSNGTVVHQYRYVGTNKLGLVDSGAGNGSYKIFFWDNPSKCLDNPGGQTANGTRVQIYDCMSNDVWQQWMIGVDSATGAATLKNVGSGKCLDDTGSTAAGTSPWIWDCNGVANQKWHVAGGYWRPGSSPLTHDSDAYVLLAGNGATNTAIDSNNVYTNGTLPTLSPAMDFDGNHQFHIVPGTAPNTWIVKFTKGGNKCLDVPGGQTANGTGVQVWDCNGGSNQNWYVNNVPHGGIMLKNQSAGRCLANGGANASSFTASMMLWDCSTDDFTQSWALTAN